jgi:Phage integrase family
MNCLFALATGCRASEITGLEWSRVDLDRKTAWLNHTKNGTPRGVPLNEEAIEVLREQIGKSLTHCFTYEGESIGCQISNTAWHTALTAAGIQDFRFHDFHHTPESTQPNQCRTNTEPKLYAMTNPDAKKAPTISRKGLIHFGILAPRPGLEPGTYGLTVRRSTN